MKIEKWQALGNEYLIIEPERLSFELSGAKVRLLCDEQQGVGADGVLELRHSDDDLISAELVIWNADGSKAELSGNGARQAFLYLRESGWAASDTLSLRTPAGVIHAELTGPDSATVEMGTAVTVSDQYPEGGADGIGQIELDGQLVAFQFVSIGNPQCAIAVDSLSALDALDLGAVGPKIENDARFPQRTNVSWWTELEPGRIRARIFERGVGETPSSGTGASGAAVASVLAGGRSPVSVVLDGGELIVNVGPQLEIELSGSANRIDQIVLSAELREQLNSA